MSQRFHSTIRCVDGTTEELLAREIAVTLRRSGYQSFLVGGCVRDRLLGLEPGDWDVATDARPEQVLALWPEARQVGAHFGVILVDNGRAHVAVATFRSDRSYSDGRHPDQIVFETDPRADVQRRDFTINALLLDPETDEVLDFTGGREDLASRTIRAIGDPDLRFQEDHLRMLRAIRFAARLSFSIAPATFEAIRRLHRLIAGVSAERIRDEVVRILTEGGARRGFELLDESRLLHVILPEVAAMKGVEQPPEYHPEGDVWTHTLMMLSRLERPTPALAFGVLLHDVGKPPTFRVADRIRFDGHAEVGAEMAARILSRLRMPADDIEQVRALVANHMKFKDVRQMRDATLKRFFRLPRFEEHLALHRIDCLSSHGSLEAFEYVNKRLIDLPPEQLRPPRLISGADLIAEGYTPGPEFRTMLDAVEDAQLENRIRSREEALALVRDRFGDPVKVQV